LSNNIVVLRPLAVFFFVFAFASIRLWTTWTILCFRFAGIIPAQYARDLI
jgi:hypothetical protein